MAAKWVLPHENSMLDPNIEDDGFITIHPDLKLIALQKIRDEAYIKFLNASGSDFTLAKHNLGNAERDLRKHIGDRLV